MIEAKICHCNQQLNLKWEVEFFHNTSKKTNEPADLFIHFLKDIGGVLPRCDLVFGLE